VRSGLSLACRHCPTAHPFVTMYRLTSLQVGDQRWWSAFDEKALAFSRQTIKKASGAAGPKLPI